MSATEGNSADHHSHGAHHGPPPPPEPKTPMWLPAVGAVLFLMVGLIWGLGSSSDETAPAAPAPNATAAADAGAAPPGH